ncbi:hypothetical protein [Azospirillum sp. Marseille-Q6669]
MAELNDIARLLRELTEAVQENTAELRGLRADLSQHHGEDAPVSKAMVQALAIHAVLIGPPLLLKPGGYCEAANAYARIMSDFLNGTGRQEARKPSAEDVAYRAANPGHWSISTLREYGVPEEDLIRIQAEREAAMPSQPRG